MFKNNKQVTEKDTFLDICAKLAYSKGDPNDCDLLYFTIDNSE